MQLWPEPERGPQRNPLKASSEVCTGFLQCTPLGLEKGSVEKYLYGLSCCKVCKAFANGCSQFSAQCTVQWSAKGQQRIPQCNWYQSAVVCILPLVCIRMLCIWVESSICNCALCRVRWTMRKYRAIGGFNAVERCERLQWAANLRGNADAAVCSDQLRTCRDLCANCICPNCKKYLSKFQNVFVQIAKVFFQVSKYICPWC